MIVVLSGHAASFSIPRRQTSMTSSSISTETTATQPRKSYRAPALTVHGTIEEITAGGRQGVAEGAVLKTV